MVTKLFAILPIVFGAHFQLDVPFSWYFPVCKSCLWLESLLENCVSRAPLQFETISLCPSTNVEFFSLKYVFSHRVWLGRALKISPMIMCKMATSALNIRDDEFLSLFYLSITCNCMWLLHFQGKLYTFTPLHRCLYFGNRREGHQLFFLNT